MGQYKLFGGLLTMLVPVVAKNQNPLMPTKPSRARKWIRDKKATPFWKNGIFCVRLNIEPSDRYFQEIAVGVDPGSKKEDFTVKSKAHTYLNVQADAHKVVGKKIAKRRELRRSRRSRKCPNRKNRTNRLANKARVPAGTRVRWDWKLRIVDWLSKLYPVTKICVEDIKARTKPDKDRWNRSFSPLEVGKRWFVSELITRFGVGNVFMYKGLWTSARRQALGLEKLSDKLSDDFSAHCVDSWVMAHSVVNGDSKKAMSMKPDNTQVFCIAPIPIRRRELHRQNPQRGGKRPRYGGTMCLGIVKNTLVKHVKHGLLRVTGYDTRGGLNLSEITSSKRIGRGAKPQSFRILTKLNFQYK
ncbi:hypothetical protein C6501_09410 [Candidatus Poribacteria bacterium]|nr:MAG: hypothetical protein C6501_09410 [Candidatus Poribacteria bacterium]